MPYIQGGINIKDWTLSDKKLSNEIKAWDGTTPGYKIWVTRVHGHASMVNPNWRRVLDTVRRMSDIFTWQWMMHNCIDGLRICTCSLLTSGGSLAR